MADGGNDPVSNANIRDAIHRDCSGRRRGPRAEADLRLTVNPPTEKNRLAVQLGPGDGAAAEHLVMDCATNSLVTGVAAEYRRLEEVTVKSLPSSSDVLGDTVSPRCHLVFALALSQCGPAAKRWLGQRGTGYR